jgi:hypothetical protein
VSKASNADEFPDDELIDERHRALVDRLRDLRWPEPPPEVRERGLEELREMLTRSSQEPVRGRLGVAVRKFPPAGPLEPSVTSRMPGDAGRRATHA